MYHIIMVHMPLLTCSNQPFKTIPPLHYHNLTSTAVNKVFVHSIKVLEISKYKTINKGKDSEVLELKYNFIKTL